MNGEIEYEKVLQIEFHRINYIVTIKSDAEGLSLQLEDKCTGDMWESFYEPHYIQQIAAKSGSQKKYEAFLKMLTNALTGSDEKLNVNLLTHQDLQQQAARKNGSVLRTTDQKLINKRYLIISYRTNYQSANYPIPLDFVDEPDPQRLKLTIRRLSQQLQFFQSNPKLDNVVKQLSTVKHQNQLLKSKLRSYNRTQSKQNLNVNYLNKQVQEQNKQLRQQISTLKLLKQQQLSKKDKIIQQKEKKISELQIKLKNQQQNDNLYQKYEEKFNKLSKEANQLVSALQHSQQNEKKSQYKIANLEKELQKMIGQVKKKNYDSKPNKVINSPRKSENGSVTSNNTNNKNRGTNKSIKKVSVGRKSSSVVDSDTQSSRMRKNNNGRVSPYRQSSRPLNTSNSSKKKQNQRVNAISKYSNISNLYKKDRDRGRSRSRSKSVKKQLSPPSDNMQPSEVMTEDIQFSDNEEFNKESDTMKRLRNRNKMIKVDKQKAKQKKTTINPIQQRISSIAQLMRKFRNNTQMRNGQ